MLNGHILIFLINNVSLAWHFFSQEYGTKPQRLMRWLQTILLVFITSLSLTSNSIQAYLTQNLNGLLGADAVISQKQALSAQHHQILNNFSDQIVVTQRINTTLSYQGKWQSVLLKAVGDDYPLQGHLVTANSLEGDGQSTKRGPRVGNIWLDARAMSSLRIGLGQQLQISNHYFTVAKILQHEPDRLMEGHTVAMRAMINSADIAKLELPADLIQYRYLLAASKQQIARLGKWQAKQLPSADFYHKQGLHPLARFWQRTENFIGLASIILFFMAAIAIDQLSQRQAQQEQYFTAICMSLGASRSTGIVISIIKWLLGIALLMPVVLLLASAFHYLLIDFLSSTFTELSWQLTLWPMVPPILSLIAIFVVFQAPVWFSLSHSSVAKQLATGRDIGKTWLSKIASIAVLAIVAFMYSDNGLLTLMMLLGLAITIGLMIFVSWLTLTLGERLTQGFSGLLPFALFMMKQRLLSKSSQIIGIGLSVFLLLFTLMLLKDLGATMSSYQRQHDGNVFISQASEQQMVFINNWTERQDISIRRVKPYINAKLIEVNQQPLAEFSRQPSESLATLRRAIRLHWTESVPENNRVVSGQWWQPSSENWQRVSVEQEVMTDLGLSLGDQLTLFINQRPYVFEITASHVFKPGAGSITFWLQIPASAIQHIEAAKYSMASLEVSEQQWPLLASLWQQFPSLRMVSLKTLTERFDRILTMVTQVVSGFSLIILLLAAVVILASVQAVESNEQKKNSIIISFGCSRGTCLKLNMIEWLVTAAITATGAISGTYITGLLIYQSQFSLNYQPNVIWLLATLLAMLSIITLLGVYASRTSLRSSVSELLANN